ncbi:hypothetical protein HK102_002414 [Quaeritorhiza haematococci]|nr:hypothetical protein HK102_002414 [Quaeritorhiza haematococci]
MIRAPRPHTPLIKFLGPRKFLSAQHASPASAASPQTASNPTKSGGKGLEYEWLVQLPLRFHKRTITEAEMKAIEISAHSAAPTTSYIEFNTSKGALSSGLDGVGGGQYV